jgi:hypothetical protein
MRKTFAPLDDALIDRLFQPVADCITCRSGIRRVTVACFCLDVASLSWILAQAPAASRAALAWDRGTAFVNICFLLLGLVALVSLRMLFGRARAQRGNQLRMALRPHRAIVLLMLVARLLEFQLPGLAETADIAMLTLVTSALYLGACGDPPPVRRAPVSANFSQLITSGWIGRPFAASCRLRFSFFDEIERLNAALELWLDAAKL